MTDENQDQNESSVIRELRQQIKERDDRLASLEPMARRAAFKEAGLDIESGPGRFFAEKYDGELTPDAIREAAEPYDLIGQATASTEEPAADETQQRMDQLRTSSTPEGAGKRISHTEWTELSQQDPQAAMEAHRNGLVDFPSHIANNLNANRDAVRLGG